MLRYCLPDNTVEYEGYACGHLWIEVDEGVTLQWSPRRRCCTTAADPDDGDSAWGGVSCRQKSFGNLHIL